MRSNFFEKHQNPSSLQLGLKCKESSGSLTFWGFYLFVFCFFVFFAIWQICDLSKLISFHPKPCCFTNSQFQVNIYLFIVWYDCPLHISNGLKTGGGGVPLRPSGGTSWIVGYSQSPHNHLVENAINKMKINPLLGQLFQGIQFVEKKRINNGFLSHPRNLKIISRMLKYESFCRFPKQVLIFMSWISLCMPPRVHSRWSWCP